MKNKAEAELPSIYWLGGSTCAGKTTISNILAKMYGFDLPYIIAMNI